MSYTPIDHLLPGPTDDTAAPPPAAGPVSAMSFSKESSPVSLSPESKSVEESGHEDEAQAEASKESTEKAKNPKIRIPGQVPTIDPTAAKAGLHVAPSAQNFPSVYDVKVPVLSDEEIIKDLKTSPLTGTRWLAELGNYVLWQAHITLKKIGGKIVREHRHDDPSIITRLKRIFWM
ncbi:MAG: hypothetical protein WCO78_05525 [Candidatus Roizmanbacteria bacterium]